MRTHNRNDLDLSESIARGNHLRRGRRTHMNTSTRMRTMGTKLGTQSDADVGMVNMR